MKKLTLLPLLILLACQDSSLSRTGQIQPGSAVPTTPGPSNTSTLENEYTYLFPEFYKGGLRVGDKTNLTFALDLQEKKQIITPPPDFPGFQGEISPKINTWFELGSYCEVSAGPPSIKPVIMTGDKAWVDSLELTMSSDSLSGESPPEKPIANEMCYGYRSNGAWVWKMDAQRATWVDSMGKYVMTFQINAGSVDAIKVFFNNGFGASRYLEKMVLVAKPAP